MTLHLLHTNPDPRRLAAWATRHRLVDAQGDLGYALHGLLRAAFGNSAPRPFRYLDADQGLLAYSSHSAADLERAAALAPPDVAAALGLGTSTKRLGMTTRVFPTQWPSGHVLGFEVRLRPVVREGKTGRERDAFLSEVERSGDAVIEREAVYVQWLRDQLLRQGGAELLDATLSRFRLLGVLRKTARDASDGKRGSKQVGGPDAVLSGRLRVSDSQAFADLLARGVGRHRAFGFGLLLLRPGSR